MTDGTETNDVLFQALICGKEMDEKFVIIFFCTFFWIILDSTTL